MNQWLKLLEETLEQQTTELNADMHQSDAAITADRGGYNMYTYLLAIL